MPVPARKVGQDLFTLLSPQGYDPESDKLEFTPGMTVRVEPHKFSDEQLGIVAVEAQPPAA